MQCVRTGNNGLCLSSDRAPVSVGLPRFGSSRGTTQKSGVEKDVIDIPRLCTITHLSGLSVTYFSFIQSKDLHYPRPALEWKSCAVKQDVELVGLTFRTTQAQTLPSTCACAVLHRKPADEVTQSPKISRLIYRRAKHSRSQTSRSFGANTRLSRIPAFRQGA